MDMCVSVSVLVSVSVSVKLSLFLCNFSWNNFFAPPLLAQLHRDESFQEGCGMPGAHGGHPPGSRAAQQLLCRPGHCAGETTWQSCVSYELTLFGVVIKNGLFSMLTQSYCINLLQLHECSFQLRRTFSRSTLP